MFDVINNIYIILFHYLNRVTLLDEILLTGNQKAITATIPNKDIFPDIRWRFVRTPEYFSWATIFLNGNRDIIINE